MFGQEINVTAGNDVAFATALMRCAGKTADDSELDFRLTVGLPKIDDQWIVMKDTFDYHRPQGPRWPATRVSENYLTGVRLTTTDRWLRNGTNKPTTQREEITRTRILIEDVDEGGDN
jgi:hypothetical protein